MMRHPKRRHRGFLLVTVVVLLAIVALMLARLSMWSMREASSALEAERHLRQKWATTSLQAYCLGNSNAGLFARVNTTRYADADNPADHPRVFRTQIRLSGTRWDVLVSDESAKVNLNRLIEERPANDVQELANECLGLSAPVHLKGPTERPTAATGGSKRLERWFRCREPDYQARRFAAGTTRLTLWGDGRVNVYRSDGVTVNALWRCLFGRRAPDELHALRRSSQRLPWDEIAAHLSLRESQREVADRWFTTESHTTSVWLFSETDRRTPAHMFVRHGSRRMGFLYN